MSFGDKLSQGFDIAKQWTMEKMGKAQRSQEEPEFVETVKMFKRNREELTALAEAANLYYDLCRRRQEAAQAMNAAMSNFGSHLDDAEDCGTGVQTYLTTQNQLDRETVKQDEAFHTMLLAPLKALVATDLTQCSDLKAAYRVAQLQYDACTNKFIEATDKDKKQIAAQEMKLATVKYEKLKRDLVLKCEEVEAKKRALLTENISFLLQSQLGYYAGAYRAFPDHISSNTDGDGGDEAKDDGVMSMGGEGQEGEGMVVAAQAPPVPQETGAVVFRQGPPANGSTS